MCFIFPRSLPRARFIVLLPSFLPPKPAINKMVKGPHLRTQRWPLKALYNAVPTTYTHQRTHSHPDGGVSATQGDSRLVRSSQGEGVSLRGRLDTHTRRRRSRGIGLETIWLPVHLLHLRSHVPPTGQRFTAGITCWLSSKALSSPTGRAEKESFSRC